jgi:hypothetical protein
MFRNRIQAPYRHTLLSTSLQEPNWLGMNLVLVMQMVCPRQMTKDVASL